MWTKLLGLSLANWQHWPRLSPWSFQMIGWRYTIWQVRTTILESLTMINNILGLPWRRCQGKRSFLSLRDFPSGSGHGGPSAWQSPPTNKSEDRSGWHQTFWPFICPDGVHINRCFQQPRVVYPYLLQGEGQTAGFTFMQGRTLFGFLALRIASGGRQTLRAGTTMCPTH